jgi:hypothetical protein
MAVARQSRIEHYLGLPVRRDAALRAQTRTALPGLSLTSVADPLQAIYPQAA